MVSFIQLLSFPLTTNDSLRHWKEEWSEMRRQSKLFQLQTWPEFLRMEWGRYSCFTAVPINIIHGRWICSSGFSSVHLWTYSWQLNADADVLHLSSALFVLWKHMAFSVSQLQRCCGCLCFQVQALGTLLMVYAGVFCLLLMNFKSYSKY